MRFVIVLLLAACGTHEEAPPPPERFRPEGFEVRVEGERMHATTTEPHRCHDLAELVRTASTRTQLLGERVLVVGCSDRWLRIDVDVQSGDSEITGGAPEVADVIEGARWILEHGTQLTETNALLHALRQCTNATAGESDSAACIEQRLSPAREAFEALTAVGPPAPDACEGSRTLAFAELALAAITAGEAPRRLTELGAIETALERFDRERYEAATTVCDRGWYLQFGAFDCVNVINGQPITSATSRCTHERAADALAHGYAPVPRAP